MDAKRQTGYLVLADISGYTGFQAKTELDHAQLAISYLLETIVEQLGSVLTIVELEGDAVFAYIEESRRPSDATLLGLLEQTYNAFRDKSLSLQKGTTCKCRACEALPMLDLKFMVHHGEFIVHQMAGRQNLFGTDVTLVHRLMKNNVSETMGWRGYALFTRQGIENCKGDKTAFVQRREAYEHLGEVEIYVANLGARYASRKAG
jgi:hypothetical protein